MIKQFYLTNNEITGTAIPDQSEPGRNDNESLLHIPQSFRTRASPSNYSVS